MHDDFPSDPATLVVGALALLAAIFGFLGGGLLWATVLLLLVGLPLLALEWLGFLVWERWGGRSA